MKGDKMQTKEWCTPVDVIREDIFKNKKSTIVLREYNKSSKKLTNEYRGEIIGSYSNLFTVQIKNQHLTQIKSFMYTDIASGLIEYEIV